MSKRNKKQGKRSQQGSILASQAWEAKTKAMRDGYGAPGARVWTDQNKRAVDSRKACRGRMAW